MIVPRHEGVAKRSSGSATSAFHGSYSCPLGGKDKTTGCMRESDVRVRPSGPGATEVRLSGCKGPQAPVFTVSYDGDALPYRQTLRNTADGINLFCIEPATHDRMPRAELSKQGALTAAEPGSVRMFRFEMGFDCGRSVA